MKNPDLIAIRRRCKHLPFGNWLFHRILFHHVPYSGTIKPTILSLESGAVIIEMDDRRRIRNHLNSIHAIAMANLGELTSGLTLLSALSMNTRAIVVGMNIKYAKKGRGKLISKCEIEKKNYSFKTEENLLASIYDNSNDLVCEVSSRWLIDPSL